jgi:hypothetical protein
LANFGDTGGSSDQDNFVDLVLSHSWVFENLLYWWNAIFEHTKAELLEFSSGDNAVEILGFSQRVNFDGGLCGRTQNTLGSFSLGSKSSHGALVVSNVYALLLEELGGTVLNKFVIEIFTSQMSVSGSGLDLEDTVLDSE